jgi:hypothetical protein
MFKNMFRGNSKPYVVPKLIADSLCAQFTTIIIITIFCIKCRAPRQGIKLLQHKLENVN